MVVFALLLWAFAVVLWEPLKERTRGGWLRVPPDLGACPISEDVDRAQELAARDLSGP